MVELGIVTHEREKCCFRNSHPCRKFSGDDHFELFSERNFDLPRALFLRGRRWGQSVLPVPFVMHVLG